jgi:hypothetical protein
MVVEVPAHVAHHDVGVFDAIGELGDGDQCHPTTVAAPIARVFHVGITVVR